MSKRFNTENANLLVALLHMGEDRGARIVSPSETIGTGCGDSGCCPQRSSASLVGVSSIRTTASASRLHRLALVMGLVAPRSSRDRAWLNKGDLV